MIHTEPTPNPESLKFLSENIISNIKKLNVKNSFYRKDIGWKVISKNENY